MIRIWTDGACLKNPGGAGGWAWVAEGDGNEVAMNCGGASTATNNTMELQAAIEALSWVRDLWKGPGPIELRSDSKYVVEGLKSWRHRWKENGWRMKNKPTAARPKNLSQWRELDKLADAVGPSVCFVWVKGHNGHRFNEEADRLANEQARHYRLGGLD